MVSGCGSELPSDSSKEINIIRSKTQKTQQEKKKKNRWLRRNSSDTDTRGFSLVFPFSGWEGVLETRLALRLGQQQGLVGEGFKHTALSLYFILDL